MMISLQSPKIYKINSENVNYLIKEDKLAYTEDGVIVSKIFAYHIPKQATWEVVKEYFKNFGKVTEVVLINDTKHRKGNRSKYSFIEFDKPEGAVKALQNQKHLLLEKKIGVKAADTWHQPSNCPIEQTEKSEKGQHDKKSALIFVLNYDCLDNICKYFNTIDLLHFAQTCQRFRTVAKMRCKIEFASFNIEELNNLTLHTSRHLLQLAGRHIRTLIGIAPKLNCRNIMTLIHKYCPNLEKVKLSKKMRTTSLRALLHKSENITEVSLTESRLHMNGVLVLKSLPNLKKLTLSKNNSYTGRYLSLLTGLTELNLSFCRNIKSQFFIEMCRTLKDLQKLNIMHCELLNNEAFHAMVDNCMELEELRMISMPFEYEFIAKLPNLKRLEVLVRSTNVRPALFSELAASKAEQLEYLKISGEDCINLQNARDIAALKQLKTLICAKNKQLTDECLRKFCQLQELQEIDLNRCTDITNDALLSLITKCKKLVCVDVQYCKNITDAFVFNAIKKLGDMQKDFRVPIKIIVTHTAISEYIVNDLKYLQAESFFKLIFDVKTEKQKYKIFQQHNFFELNNDDFYYNALIDEDEYDVDDLDFEFDDEVDDVDDVDDPFGVDYDPEEIDDDVMFNDFDDDIADIADYWF